MAFPNTDHRDNISPTQSPEIGAHHVYAIVPPTPHPPTRLEPQYDAVVFQEGDGSEMCQKGQAQKLRGHILCSSDTEGRGGGEGWGWVAAK